MSRNAHRGRVNHERWLVSYADFITLLFAFFVVLYAFAKTDEKKQVQVSAAISTAFRSLGLFPGAALHPTRQRHSDVAAQSSNGPLSIVVAQELVAPPSVRRNLEHLEHQLQQSLSGQISQNTVAIHLGRDGLVISLREAGFFHSGSATPRPRSINTLNEIASSLGRTPYDVRIEGHTDNVPIHNAEFDSNWELSTARATRIARLFLQFHAISPDRLSAAGYSEYHPVASNATAEGRAMNRRVDLVVMPRLDFNFQTGTYGAAPTSPSAPWQRITDGDRSAKPASATTH